MDPLDPDLDLSGGLLEPPPYPRCPPSEDLGLDPDLCGDLDLDLGGCLPAELEFLYCDCDLLRDLRGSLRSIVDEALQFLEMQYGLFECRMSTN